jgi:thioredoxin 1
MAKANVLEINDLNFDTEVKGSQLTFLLDLTATWCGPCRMLGPIVERIADENLATLRVGQLDIDEATAVAARLGVRSVPTIVVFRGGEEIARHVGVTDKATILRLCGFAPAAAATHAAVRV